MHPADQARPSTRSTPISIEGLPLRERDAGDTVDELRRRLGRAGFITTDDPRGTYGAETTDQVKAFQRSRGLHADGVCGFQTWAALLEADHRFGERTLYLRQPMLRGDDVAELQRCLGALGFDAGRIDGIFGADTARAVGEYQQNVGLTVDGVCGRDTYLELAKVASRTGQLSVATVRERERLLRPAPTDAPPRVAVGDLGNRPILADALARSLAARGVDVEVIHHPDPASQADAANGHQAVAYLGLQEAEGANVAYFATNGYVSTGGQHLAELVAAKLPTVGLDRAAAEGMRLPVLRFTRMPAVVCRTGPLAPAFDTDEIATALADAVVEWLRSPVSTA